MFTLNKHGNFTPGFHKVELKDIEVNLVNGFPLSKNRKRNFPSFIEVLKSNYVFDYKEIISEIWIDGSFCTSKVEPNDIDGVILFEITTAEELSKFLDFRKQWKANLNDLFQMNYCHLFPVLNIDSVYLLHTDAVKSGDSDIMKLSNIFEEEYTYWSDWFSTDRDGKSKALYSIDYRKEFC